MTGTEKRYERHGGSKPCILNRQDIFNLGQIIQATFSKPEIERYFRISTSLNHTRVFSNSIDHLLTLEGLGDRITDLSFWIEGWDQKTRFDKNILLDFSKYSIRLSVEGTDPVWVYDQYNHINRYLEGKTAWYWPVIIMERVLAFFITVVLVINIIIGIKKGAQLYHFDQVGLLSAWMFLVFYDTRRIWPFANIRLGWTSSSLSRENVFMVLMIFVLLVALLGGIFLPLIR